VLFFSFVLFTCSYNIQGFFLFIDVDQNFPSDQNYSVNYIVNLKIFLMFSVFLGYDLKTFDDGVTKVGFELTSRYN